MTVTVRKVRLSVARDFRRYAGSQGATQADVFEGLWQFRALVLDGMAPDAAAAKAGVPRGRAL